MKNDYTAMASTKINAPAEVVWNALVNPEAIMSAGAKRSPRVWTRVSTWPASKTRCAV